MNTHEWHLDATAVAAYAAGTATEAVAWSVETHLQACAECRALIAYAMEPADRTLLSISRAELTLPAQTARRRRTHQAVAAGVLGPWWAWLGLVAFALIALVIAGAAPVANDSSQHGLTWVLALSPIIPVAMVAAVYQMADRDPTTLTTPRGGLELVLIRTTAVLALALPTVALGSWYAGSSSLTWLLPSLGLCSGVLTAGSWIGVERAAMAITLGWTAVIAAAMLPGSALATAVAAVVAPSATGTAMWLGALILSAAAVVARRGHFDLPRGL